MRIRYAISGDLQQALEEQGAEKSAELREAMDRVATSLQLDLRMQTESAGLGIGLVKAWQKADYENADKVFSPAALVYSKATVIHRAFIQGATITAGRSRYLAIPTVAAEAMGLATSSTRRDGKASGDIPHRRSQVEQAADKLGARNVEVLPAKRGRRIVVYTTPEQRRAKAKGTVLFILVPQVRLARRIDFDAAATRAQARLEAEVRAVMGGG